MIVFHIPGPLLAFTGGRGRVEIETTAATVGEALTTLFALHPGVRDRVVDERGGLRRHVNVFVGRESIRYTNGLATPLSDGAEVSIIPAISGGVYDPSVNDRFLRACRREAVDRTPVWFMRQAGRYMPAYRALREKHSLLTLCRTPELAVEVTLQPVRALGVDAAILFSDLLLPLAPMGIPFDFKAGDGPVIEKTIRSRSDIKALRRFDPREDLGTVLEAIRLLRRELDAEAPLIGFAGAPFTLASYTIEGGHSTNFAATKALMYHDPQAWHQLAALLADVVRDYLRAQIEAGAQALQLFDSWVGALDETDYREFVFPHVKAILDGLRGLGVPVIHFGTGTGHLLALQREAGGDVIGVDWRTPLDEAWQRVGHAVAVQGNLDPTLLLGPRDRLLARVDDVLRRAGGRPGHIFNLGHGILPGTPVENVKAVVAHVHEKIASRPQRGLLIAEPGFTPGEAELGEPPSEDAQKR